MTSGNDRKAVRLSGHCSVFTGNSRTFAKELPASVRLSVQHSIG